MEKSRYNARRTVEKSGKEIVIEWGSQVVSHSKVKGVSDERREMTTNNFQTPDAMVEWIERRWLPKGYWYLLYKLGKFSGHSICFLPKSVNFWS